MEDERDVRENIAKYLRIEEFEVDVASTGVEGWQMFQKKFYDMVLLDWMLPEMTGIEVCQEIRKTRELPIIFLTAKGQIDDKLE